MKRPLTLFFLFIAIIATASQSTNRKISIIPIPASVEEKEGEFTITEETRVILSQKSEETELASRYLAGMLNKATGFNIQVSKGNSAKEGSIFLNIDESIRNKEGYTLIVTNKGVTIEAKEAVGLFYGIQTLRQLLPVEIESVNLIDNVEWTVPAVEIEDSPRYVYRGMMLDVGRHFFPVDYVKKFIDLIAMHKMNTMHWHLTEDQGWRIEIKKYPKLTEIGAWRDETIIGHARNKKAKFDGKRYGGFYTQDEIKEVVAYATERFVTIIPEIELPGHAQAALAAYPELGCVGGSYDVSTTWGVHKEVFCPNEKTFDFWKNVLGEVIPLFPGTYIHIGGDECKKDRWEKCYNCQSLIRKEGLKDEYELQSFVIKRIEKFLESKGKKLIGWDEIMEGGLSPNATVMAWRGMDRGIEAAKQGHDVIMTPTSHCYFDFYQKKPQKKEPLAIGGYLPAKTVYRLEPSPNALSAEEKQHILGAQGNIWTEYIATSEYLEYMALPRMTALSEVVWSLKKRRNWNSFTKRLPSQLKRYKLLGFNYADHMLKKNN
jgi:hexosaminidase